MVFTSLEFLFLFLPLSILLHAAAPERCRNGVLLLLSVLFLIGGGLPRLGLFLAMLLCSYGCGLFLERCKGKHVLCGVLLILLFLLHGVLLAVLRPSSYSSAVAAWLYPLGISYLALQGIGYCLDIAKGSIPAEHRLLSFATYYLFYPKVLMGPVVSYADWKQILSEKQCDVPQIGAGLRLLVLGLGKKLLLANSAGLLHEVVQQSAGSEHSMLAAWLSVLSFAAQLWLEGAAYSDMACGLASCYGLRLPENFGPLVLSKTVTDWVRNWNCTVVQWFHRSMYLPVSTKHWYGIAGQTIWIWLWIGVWCGNGVQFIGCGIWMGICMTLEYLLQRKMRHWYPSVQHIWTAAWLLGAVILLQASSLPDLQENLTVLFGRGRLIREQDQYLLFNGGLELAAVLALLMVLPKWNTVRAVYEKKAAALFRVLEPVGLLLLLLTSAAVLFYQQDVSILFQL